MFFTELREFTRTVFKGHQTIVIGLSGGPDSVFLLQLIAQLSDKKIIAAHLDHGWRENSHLDAEFCKEIANHYGATFALKKISELSFTHKYNGSKEEMGRKARRHFLESIAQEYNATAIALAHHADDQQETFFIRLLRGAHLTGLTGIKMKDGLYVRPLLQTKKLDILEHLHTENIRYCIDESNLSDDFLRNRIRNSVIPALQKADDRFDKNFASTHAHLQQTEEFLEQLTQQTLARICIEESSIKRDEFLQLNPFMQKRILIAWLITNSIPFVPSQGLVDELMRFLHQPKNGTHELYQKWTLQKTNNLIVLKRMDCL